MTIIYWTVSWLTGIWLASNWRCPSPAWLTLGALALLLALLPRLRHWRSLSICLLILTLGAARYQWAASPLSENHISQFNSIDESKVTGLITAEPDVRENYTSLVMEADRLFADDGAVMPVQGKVLVRADRYPAIPYGSRLQITGQLKTPVGSAAGYQEYLARRGIYSEMNRPHIVVLETGAGNPVMTELLAFKARAHQTINRLFSEPQAALLNGILLGYDRGLPQQLAEDFQATGTSHIIAISGFNIAIIAGILLRGGRYFLAPRPAGIFALVAVTLYTILVGADAAVVRAAIMGAMFIIATLFLGWPTYIYAALFASALFMTLANPLLLWDIGFQLSFMAILGLMLYVGPWSKRIGTVLEPRLGEDMAHRLTRMLADVFLATMAAILMTMPVMLVHFSTLSLISPLANFLILPAQPGIMVLGGLATLTGMVSPAVAQLPAWPAWFLLTYTIRVVEYLAQLPYAAVDVSFLAGGAIAYYILLFGVTWIGGPKEQNQIELLGRSRRSRLLRLGLATAIFLLILAGLWLWNQPDGNLHITFFDVDQGDAILIQSPKGRQVVVDGGRYPSLFLDELGRDIPFWDKDIDIVVATHPDEDHTLGLVPAFDHYAVDLLLVNGESDQSAAYTALQDAASGQQTLIRRALAGETVDLGDGARLEILHPGSTLDDADRNENSVVLRLVYGEFAALLTGDAEEEAEQAMIAGGHPLQSTVFKAGHHGSRSSSSRAFLQAVQPQIVIISAGQENRYDHPHPEVLQRAAEIGATVLRTDEAGSIEVITDGEQFWLETEE